MGCTQQTWRAARLHGYVPAESGGFLEGQEMMKRLQKRVEKLESYLPTPEDEDARRHAAFLHDCTDRELDLLEIVTAAQECGEEPPSLTDEEKMIVDAAIERWRTHYADS
jgi:hypothetical protein